jgi:hypothetical protein
MSQDYSNLGLASNLMSQNSLANKDNNFIDSYTLDSLSDTNTITARQAGNISQLHADYNSLQDATYPQRSTTSSTLVDIPNTTMVFTIIKKSRVEIF